VRIDAGLHDGLVGYVLENDLRFTTSAAFMLEKAGSFAEPTVTTAGKVVARFDFGDIIVHHRYHLLEASTDQSWANTLLGSRMAGNRDGIELAYRQPGYLHYGNDGEPSSPLCNVADQDTVSVSHDKDNMIGWDSPEDAIGCDLPDGTRVFATSFSSENIANE
jgi:hypothetical protein